MTISSRLKRASVAKTGVLISYTVSALQVRRQDYEFTVTRVHVCERQGLGLVAARSAVHRGVERVWVFGFVRITIVLVDATTSLRESAVYRLLVKRPQMLSFPLNTTNNSPWSGDTVVAPITSALPALSLLDVPASLHVAGFAFAMAWLASVCALTFAVGRSFTRAQFASSFPVKVRV